MSKFKSPYREDRIVPLAGWGGRVVKVGEVIAVPDELDIEFKAAGWEQIVVPAANTAKAEKESK